MPDTPAPALTADVAKLIERLREIGACGLGAHSETAHDAADALERLSAELSAWQSAAAHGETPAPGDEYTPARLEERLSAHMAERDRLRAEVANTAAVLADPIAVYANVLRGGIAKPLAWTQAEERADVLEERVKALEEALSEATGLLHRCNGTFVPDNDEANAEIANARRRFAALSPPPQAPQDAVPREVADERAINALLNMGMHETAEMLAAALGDDHSWYRLYREDAEAARAAGLLEGR